MSLSLQSSNNSLPNESLWHASKDGSKYSFGKTISDSKILSVNIHIFDEKNNQRLEVHARTYNLETYLKIVDVAQSYFSDKTKYHFDSTYDRFPKDPQGQCTVEVVKTHSQLTKGLFEKTHLESSLAYYSWYETKEELTKQLAVALNILAGADTAVKEINTYLESFSLK